MPDGLLNPNIWMLCMNRYLMLCSPQTRGMIVTLLSTSHLKAMLPALREMLRTRRMLLRPRRSISRIQKHRRSRQAPIVLLKLAYSNKSQILKNFQKVTNIRLPDPTINKLSQNPNVTFRDLFVEISREQKPKPTTTHAHLQRNRDLAHQRNVHMSGSKITPVHKERKIGREKVVRKELEARGLVEPRGTDIIWARITKSARQRRAA